MAQLNFPNQLKFTGRGYLDTKIGKIVNTLEELNNLDYTTLFKGYTVIVLDDGSDYGPCEYWIPGDDKQWVKKTDFGKLSLQMDEKFIQLTYNGELVSDPIDISKLYEDKFLENVEVVYEDDKKNPGVFLKFTYGGEATQRADYVNIGESLAKSLALDSNSLEYLEDGKTLSVKVKPEEKGESPKLEKTTEGLGIFFPITGNDAGVEIF